MNEDKLLNYVILGDSGVGKSSILNQFIKYDFNSNQSTTVGLEFCVSKININGYNINLHIWDLSGQCTYQNLVKKYCNEANGVILVYDVNNRRTFNYLEKWIFDIRNNTRPNIKIILVGNKTDLDNRVVTKEDGIHFALINKLLFIETSAKSYISVYNLFVKLTNSIYDYSNDISYDISNSVISCQMSIINIMTDLYSDWYNYLWYDIK